MGDPSPISLPEGTAALLFDMDGVLTDTAAVHARAWKDAFDAVLARLGREDDRFDASSDYRAHVDGRSRLDGVRAFLASRGIELPEGGPNDPADALTVHGVGRRKNELVLALLRSDGVHAYPDATVLLDRAGERDVPCAVVSSSANAREALAAAGLSDRFAAWVDGVRIAAEGLAGKPAPDTFLAAAGDLGVAPKHAVVLEDALAGVQAGRAGRFGCVVGVDRVGRAEALREHGADVVVDDLRALRL